MELPHALRQLRCYRHAFLNTTRGEPACQAINASDSESWYDLLFLENQLVLRAVADHEQQHIHQDLGEDIGQADGGQQQDAEVIQDHDDGDQQVVADEGAVIRLGLEHHFAVEEVVAQGADDARAGDGDQHDGGYQPAQQQEADIVHAGGNERGEQERAGLTEEQIVQLSITLETVLDNGLRLAEEASV